MSSNRIIYWTENALGYAIKHEFSRCSDYSVKNVTFISFLVQRCIQINFMRLREERGRKRVFKKKSFRRHFASALTAAASSVGSVRAIGAAYMYAGFHLSTKRERPRAGEARTWVSTYTRNHAERELRAGAYNLIKRASLAGGLMKQSVNNNSAFMTDARE